MRTAKSLVTLGVLVAFATGAVGATAGQQRAQVGPSFKVVGKWGKIGTTGNGVFNNARGIATDKAGNVYVADTDNRRVQVFSKTGTFLRKWGTVGGGNSQFLNAEDINIAPNGTVWVADQGNSRLQAFSSDGEFKTSISTGQALPRGIGVDAKGNVLANVDGGALGGFRRWVEKPTGWEEDGGLMGAGSYRTDEIEGSPDGTIYLATAAPQSADDRIRRYSADGKALNTLKRGNGDGTRGIGVDLDCNVWLPNTAQRRIEKFSPSGKLLATAAVTDLIANDIAVGPTGDLYVIHQNTGIVHFAEDKSKPATAGVPGTIKVANGKAKVRFALPGVACPAQVAATVTLAGKGVAGKLTTTVGAGKFTNLKIPVRGPAGKTVPATFKIVLKTNGRPTTQIRQVKVSFPK